MHSAQTRYCQSPELFYIRKPCNRCLVQKDLLNLLQSSPKNTGKHAGPDLLSKIICSFLQEHSKKENTNVSLSLEARI